MKKMLQLIWALIPLWIASASDQGAPFRVLILYWLLWGSLTLVVWLYVNAGKIGIRERAKKVSQALSMVLSNINAK